MCSRDMLLSLVVSAMLQTSVSYGHSTVSYCNLVPALREESARKHVDLANHRNPALSRRGALDV